MGFVLSKSQSIKVQGACSLSNIREQHALVAAALRGDGPVLLDLSDVQDADISFVQLLASAARTAAQQGRSFRLDGVPATLVQTFSRAGLGLDPAGQISHS